MHRKWYVIARTRGCRAPFLGFDQIGHGLIILFLHPEHPIPVKCLSNKEIEDKTDYRKEEEYHKPCDGCRRILPLDKDDGQCKNDVGNNDDRIDEIYEKLKHFGYHK